MVLKFEPALIVQLIGAAIVLVVAFGAPIDDAQKQAIIGFATIVVAIMVGQGVITRSVVYSPATVDDIKQEHYDSGYEDGMDAR